MAAKKLALDVDDFVDAALATAEQKFGAERCYVAADHESKQIVLPIKPLSLRWLIESNGWPLGRLTQSGGPFGTHKSSFIFQLIKWFLDAGGFAVLIDTENKTSMSLMRSMIGDEYFDKDNPKHKRLLILNAASVNEWQQAITSQYTRLKELVEKLKKRPSFPIIWAVDSLMGSGSAENLEHVQTEGEAMGRGYQDAPILISNFMRTTAGMLLSWPINLHCSNHEKPAIGGPGGYTRAGGKSGEFYSSLDIVFRRGGVSAFGKSLEYSKQGGNVQRKSITLEIRKSSMGSDVDKKITVPFCWRFESNPDRQISWWSWDSATAMLLAEKESVVKDVMDVNHTPKNTVGEVFWSSKLGMKADDAVPAEEFGALVDNNVELKLQLENALHIQQHPAFNAAL